MNKLPKLSDHELHSVLLNALRCAADKYDSNAKELRADSACEWPRLAEQFEAQADEARALADKLEEDLTDD